MVPFNGHTFPAQSLRIREAGSVGIGTSAPGISFSNAATNMVANNYTLTSALKL